jgi:hypothetical protein
MLATPETFPLIPSTRAARNTLTNECSGAGTVRGFNNIRRSPALKRLWLFKYQELNFQEAGGVFGCSHSIVESHDGSD